MTTLTFTKEELQKLFCVPDTKQALQGVRNQQDKLWNIDNTVELVDIIGKRMMQAIKEHGEEWDTISRTLWIVKEAYIYGFLQATEIALQAAQMVVDDLFDGRFDS